MDEHGIKVREEGCEVWVTLRALPKQLRAIARGVVAATRGGHDSRHSVKRSR